MKSKTIKGTTAGEIEKALAEAMAGGYEPTLAIVFLSIKQDRESICKLLDKNGIAIFGATTAGE